MNESLFLKLPNQFCPLFLTVGLFACSPSESTVDDVIRMQVGGDLGTGGESIGGVDQMYGGEGGVHLVGGVSVGGGTGGEFMGGAGGNGVGGFGGLNLGGSGGMNLGGEAGGEAGSAGAGASDVGPPSACAEMDFSVSGSGGEPLNDVEQCKRVHCAHFQCCLAEEGYCASLQEGAGGAEIAGSLLDDCEGFCEADPTFVSHLVPQSDCADVVRAVSSKSDEIAQACFSDEQICEYFMGVSFGCIVEECERVSVLRQYYEPPFAGLCVSSFDNNGFYRFPTVPDQTYSRSEIVLFKDELCQYEAVSSIRDVYFRDDALSSYCEMTEEEAAFFEEQCVPACRRTVQCDESGEVDLDIVFAEQGPCYDACIRDYVNSTNLDRWDCVLALQESPGYCASEVGPCVCDPEVVQCGE